MPPLVQPWERPASRLGTVLRVEATGKGLPVAAMEVTMERLVLLTAQRRHSTRRLLQPTARHRLSTARHRRPTAQPVLLTLQRVLHTAPAPEKKTSPLVGVVCRICMSYFTYHLVLIVLIN